MAGDEQMRHEDVTDARIVEVRVGDALADAERAPLEERAARYRALVDRLVERLEPPAVP